MKVLARDAEAYLFRHPEHSEGSTGEMVRFHASKIEGDLMKQLFVIFVLVFTSALPSFGQEPRSDWPTTVWREDAFQQEALERVLRVTSVDSSRPVTVEVAWLVKEENNRLLVEERTTPFELKINSEVFGALLKRTGGSAQMKVEVVVRSEGQEHIPLQGAGEAVIVNSSGGEQKIQTF